MFQKTELTQTIESVFADRIQQVEKTKFNFELFKFIDCFLDGGGNYTTSLVFLKIKSLFCNHFLNTKEVSVNHLVVQSV